MGNLTCSASLGLDAFESDPVELCPGTTEAGLQTVIQAVYKQVLGNAHLMECDRLSSAEALLRNGDITVRQFVNLVAKSSLYQSLFFHSSSPYQFIELNCKHLLGRAPLDQAEIAEHVACYNDQGYDAEIDSYIDSDEYLQAFGENTVPYPRSIQSQTGIKNSGFNRMLSLLRGSPTSDSGTKARLISDLAANLPTAIEAPAKGNGAVGSTGKRYRIAYSTASASARLNKSSKQTRLVSYNQMSQEIQTIQRAGGKILSIAEQS